MASLITHHFAFCFLLTFYSIFSPSIAESYTVKIRNTIPHPVQVQCNWNGKQDLGKRTIGASIFIYTIYLPIHNDQENILWCAMGAENKSREFKVFDYKRDISLCAEHKLCYWIVSYNGLCLHAPNGCALHYDW